ncbi:MAG: hypothetical protein LBN94_03355 [Puniceicoccales bacterium]|jgi:hypothetical protein|nr:hypothetical protein [Puniceicoccales bacterium]
MEKNIQSVDHFTAIVPVLSIALLALGEKIIRDVHGEDTSIADVNVLAGTLQKLVSCYSELQPFIPVPVPNSHGALSSEVVDSIQSQLNLL